MLPYTMPLQQGPPPVLPVAVPPGAPVPGPSTPQGPNSPFTRGVVWLMKLSTATVGLAVANSGQMKTLVEYVINATCSKAKGINEVLQRDERKHVQEFISATDSLKMGVPPMPTPPVAPKTEVTSPSSSAGKHALRRPRSYKPAPYLSTAPSQQLPAQFTYAEQQRILGEQEGIDWEKNINDSGLQHHRFVKFLGPTVVKGTLYSTATVATYKEMVLHASFTLKSGEVREADEIIREFLPPGGSVPVKVKFKTPAHTVKIEYKVNGAGYLLPH